ncbi:phosphate ABC transporter substrate-binding protein PstS [Lysobacter korlensis]|uniref:Phosphate-binding protein PstS n=1 Tax=Lysobacter korlensis TaxID=553636 RepID=A0ABV6RWK6_9GAMM
MSDSSISARPRTALRSGRFGAAALSALLLVGCAVNETAAEPGPLQGVLVGAGSSAQSIAQEVWVSEFQTANGGVRIDYDPVGSGAGREQFIEGGVDFAGSDAALSEDDLEREFAGCAPGSKALDLPVYVAPLVLIFNIDGVERLNLDPDAIAGIFSGRIERWNDPALAALNPDVELPDEIVTAVHRSDPSGTTKNFTDYLHANSPEIWPDEAADEFPYGGEAAQGNSGVVNSVTTGRNTIGYVDASRADDLPVAALQVGDEFVEYSAEAAARVLDESPLAERPNEHDLVVEVDRTSTADGVYPLVLVSYAIACEEYPDERTAELVRAYLSYVASREGQLEVSDLAGSAPLSEEFSAEVLEAVAAIR